MKWAYQEREQMSVTVTITVTISNNFFLLTQTCNAYGAGLSGGAGSGRSPGVAARSGLCHSWSPAVHPSSSQRPAGELGSRVFCLMRAQRVVICQKQNRNQKLPLYQDQAAVVCQEVYMIRVKNTENS